MSDLGLSHVAFLVADLTRSIAFYAKYAAMQVIHYRDGGHPGTHVAWMTDGTRPFVLVLIETRAGKDTPLGPFGHLGVGLPSREAVDQLAAEARREGILRSEPVDSGPPVGYWTLIADPDDNTLELAYGQDIAFAVSAAGLGPA